MFDFPHCSIDYLFCFFPFCPFVQGPKSLWGVLRTLGAPGVEFDVCHAQKLDCIAISEDGHQSFHEDFHDAMDDHEPYTMGIQNSSLRRPNVLMFFGN